MDALISEAIVGILRNTLLLLLGLSIYSISPSVFWHRAFCVLPCFLHSLYHPNLSTFLSCTPDLSELDKANFLTKFRSEFQAVFLMGSLILPILNFYVTTLDMTFIPVFNSSMALSVLLLKAVQSILEYLVL